MSLHFIGSFSHTLQLLNLRSRTGAEAMVFLTRGTTDMAMRSIYFASPGVHSFMGGVMKIDPQDFLSKLEGFALQGVAGMCTGCVNVL
jgi:hypothetical protein